MSRSRKKNPTSVDIPKGAWKHEYNSRIRTKSNQLLNQVINGKLDPDELILPNEDSVGLDVHCSPKEDVHRWNFSLQHNFSDEHPIDDYLEDLEYYEKAFRK